MSTPEVLLEQIKNSDSNLRRKAIRDLTNYPDNKEVVKALCDALGDSNKGVQNLALEVLSTMKHDNVVIGLIETVKSHDLNIRNAGMTILRNLGAMAVAPIVKALEESTDVDEIIQLIVILGDIKSHVATDTVLKYINHEDDNVKTTAVESLGKIQDPKAVKQLLETYKNTDILKYSIVEALGNIAVDEVLPVLIGAIDSGDMLEYFTAIGALGATESPKVIDVLCKKLLEEEDDGTRRLIFKSLAQVEEANPGCLKTIVSTNILQILVALLENHDAAEYRYLVKVASSLENEVFAKSLLDAIQSSEEDISNTAFDGLCKLGNKGVKIALEKIGIVEPPVAVKILRYLERNPSVEVPEAISVLSNNPDDALRQTLAKTLGACKSEVSFVTLKEMLNDVDETVRKNAVVSMSGMLDCPGAIQALIAKFKDINGHVRREACSAMLNTGSAEIIEPLFNVISTEPYGDVREAAATVLACRRDPEITKRLLALLDNNNSRIRETISKTIWKCGSTVAVDSLINKLSDSEWRVIVNSCNSLENMRDLKSIFPLKELLKNSDWQIRIAALSALRAFKSNQLKQFYIPLLADENPQVAKLAVVALSEIGDKSLDSDLNKFINHNRWEVRYQIVKALGSIKSTNSLELLKEIVQKDSCNAVRSEAILTLAKLGDSTSSDIIFKILDNEDKNLVVSAIKYFKDKPDSHQGLEEKIKDIFCKDVWVKDYFISTFAQNNSEFIEKILKDVVAPRQARFIDHIKKTTSDKSGMDDEEALLIKEIVADKCGIEIKDKKVLESKLKKELSKFFITSWLEYYHSLRYGCEDSMLTSLYDSITNPVTEFFGEPQQTKVLISNILPELIEERVKANSEKLRILCCGTSYGPEAYSVALSVMEDLHTDRIDIEVTGIDISNICLNTAKRGIYKREIFRFVDQKYTDIYFEDDRGDLRIKDEVKNMIEFKFTNTLDSEAMEKLGEYDVVICRNLFSDFSQKAKERMAENIYNILVPGGVLLIASKESLYNVTKAFRLQSFDKVVAYRKL